MNSIRVRPDGKYIAIWCKGCRHIHGWLPLKVNGRADGWTWEQATQTLSPSVRHFVPAREATADRPGHPERTTCHYNITNGRILFHGDSTDHALRGEHALDEEPPANYGGQEYLGFGAAGAQGTG